MHLHVDHYFAFCAALFWTSTSRRAGCGVVIDEELPRQVWLGVLGMASTVKKSQAELNSFAAIFAAILLTMLVTYFCLIYATKLAAGLGATGIDAITRIVGFFVSAIGVALIFDGVIEVLQLHGVIN
jgi:hypothetical protein